MGVEMIGEEVTNAVLVHIEEMADHLAPTMQDVGEIAHDYVELETPVDSGLLVSQLHHDVESGGDRIYVEVWYDETYGPYGHRYDHYVKGEGMQAWMHRGRVSTIVDDLMAIESMIVGMIQARVNEVVNGS